MKHTQVFVFIGCVAFCTVTGQTWQNLSPMERLRRQAGTLINRDNRNCNVLAGNACYGSIVGNRNSDYQCEKSSVEVLDNRNAKASALSSKLEMKSNANIEIEAQDAWCKFEDNRNVEFKGSGGFNQFLSQFVGNRNAKFEGTNNRVVANYNHNLSVKGNNNQLEISNTRNHAVQPAASSRNTVTVLKKDSGNTNFHYDIEYVRSAQIDGSKYRLGNYNFDVTASNDKIRVTMQNAVVKEKTSSKIVIGGQGSQTLELNGVRVETVGSNSFDIFVV